MKHIDCELMAHSLLVHGVVPQVREAHPGPETTRTGSREELEPGFTLLVRTFAKGRLDLQVPRQRSAQIFRSQLEVNLAPMHIILDDDLYTFLALATDGVLPRLGPLADGKTLLRLGVPLATTWCLSSGRPS